MGVTIEQYRARSGVDNNVKIKVDSTTAQLENNFWETMLMLFQLVITIMILIILMLIFYLSVVYLLTKRKG